MDINFVKTLISRVEYLGLDTESLRDLIKYTHSNEVSLSNYSQSLKALDIILTTVRFDSNSQPPQVSMLLKQLDKRLQNRNEEKANPVATQNSSGDVGLTSEIMASLLDIKSTLAGLNKPQQGQQQNPHSIGNHIDAIEMSTVFVNPIDQSKVDDIKATVSIESKVGGNIQSKLDKLKNLKKGT